MFVLRNRFGRVSAQTIASALNCPLFTEDDELPITDFVVRWGSTKDIDCNNEFNKATSIRNSSHKGNCRHLLSENGISVPQTFLTKESINIFPVIGRRNYHFGGHNLIISNNVEEVVADTNSQYWSKIITKDREFRVYVVCNKCVAVSEKIPESTDTIAWNHSQGAKFVNIKWSDWPIGLVTLAISATTVLDLDFSAVDLMTLENTIYVLELNTAPRIDGYRSKCFTKVFEYMTLNGFDRLDIGGSNWKELIHPSLFPQ
mgnify:CR=1 FL=1